MKKILSFELFEARYSQHFSKRVKERIENLQEVTLDTLNKETIESKIEQTIGSKWKEYLIDSIVNNLEKRILDKVKLVTFPQNSNFAVPISFLFLDFEGKSYPIEITSYSTKEDDVEQSVYKGSQIWVAVSADTAWTLKLFDKTKSADVIASNMKSGTSERYKKDSFSLDSPGENFRVRFSWNPETMAFETGEEEKKIYTSGEKAIPERKTLSPGDLVGLIINKISPDDFTYGEIKEITNMGDIKDKQKIGSLSSVEGIKLSFLPSKKEDRIVSNGREIPFVSTVKPGSRINLNGKEYIVLGPEGGKPLVTSEPSIINADRVQTWVEEIIPSAS
jgi:hypothetical protein